MKELLAIEIILITICESSNLNKENLVNKIKTGIETSLNKENLDEKTKKDLEECLKQ
ncbi:MAG: hypothetical protein O7157_02350 [Wolbachia endosymbiont of Tetragnatha montana]|nr:hypothetical protein [Wolbachia endosymbiont of Tetragnatha montana]